MTAWSDEPTEGQLNTLFRYFKWEMEREKALQALVYLQNIATRSDVSREIQRVKALKEKHALTEAKCLEGEIWEGFEYDRG